MRKWLIGFGTAILAGLVLWWLTYQEDFSLSTDRGYVDVSGGTIWEQIAAKNTGNKELSNFDLQIVLSWYRLHPQAQSASRANGFDFYVSRGFSPGRSSTCRRTDNYAGVGRAGVTIAEFKCALVNPKENLLIDIRYPSVYERTPNVTIRLRCKGFSYEETFDGESLHCEDIGGEIYCRP